MDFNDFDLDEEEEENQRRMDENSIGTSTSAIRNLFGGVGAGRGTGRGGRGGGRGMGRAMGTSAEDSMARIMGEDHPRLAEIGKALQTFSPSKKAKALKEYLPKLPRCQSPTHTEEELEEIYSDSASWAKFESEKLSATEAISAFHGASELRFQEELQKMERKFRKTAIQPNIPIAGNPTPSMQNVNAQGWILPDAPEGNLGQIMERKFLATFRENQTFPEALSKCVKALLEKFYFLPTHMNLRELL